MCPLIHFFAPYGAKCPDCVANTNYNQLPPTFTNSHQLRLAKGGLPGFPGRTRQKPAETGST